MPKALDLTNQVFGNLKAISKAPSKSGKTYWLCECLLCGNQKEIQTSHLTNGFITSCGCKKINPFVDKHLEKKCILCEEKFISTSVARKYCYNCSPQGATSAEALRRKKKILKNKLVIYKGGKCQECGYNKCIAALQFHHRDPEEKEFEISHVNLNDTNFSLKKMYLEADKCDLLCANCHAEKHYKED